MKKLLVRALAPIVIIGGMWYTPSASGQTLTYTVATVFPVGNLPTCVAAGDFNGDGTPDVAVTTQSGVGILLNNGSGFQPVVNYTAGTNPQSVAAADFNGDGKLDL